MELRDIEYFAVVAEHGNVRRAADALGLSQPALSMSLRRLEKSLNAKLVKRTPKGIELTAVGSSLLSHVRRLRLAFDDVVREAADLSEGRAGELRIGSPTGLAEELVAPACSALLKAAPKVTLTISVASSAVVLAAVRDGALDLAVSLVAASSYEGLLQEHLFDDVIVVRAASTHRLAKRRRITIADIAQEQWALPSGNVLAWQNLHRAFEKHGLAPPRITVAANSIPFREHILATSDLLSFGPRRIARRAAPNGLAILPVEELTWIQSVSVSYRKGVYLPPAGLRFIEMLKETARKITEKMR